MASQCVAMLACISDTIVRYDVTERCMLVKLTSQHPVRCGMSDDCEAVNETTPLLLSPQRHHPLLVSILITPEWRTSPSQPDTRRSPARREMQGEKVAVCIAWRSVGLVNWIHDMIHGAMINTLYMIVISGYNKEIPVVQEQVHIEINLTECVPLYDMYIIAYVARCNFTRPTMTDISAKGYFIIIMQPGTREVFFYCNTLCHQFTSFITNFAPIFQIKFAPIAAHYVGAARAPCDVINPSWTRSIVKRMVVIGVKRPLYVFTPFNTICLYCENTDTRK